MIDRSWLTPRRMIMESIKRAFFPALRPLMEGRDLDSPTPMRSYLERIIAAAERKR